MFDRMKWNIVTVGFYCVEKNVDVINGSKMKLDSVDKLGCKRTTQIKLDSKIPDSVQVLTNGCLGTPP
jgi:hypothetical protein